MAQLNMRIDGDLKNRAERQFKAMGLTTSVAVTMFFTQVVRQNRIPFEIQSDPFYSDANLDELERRAREMDAGLAQEHELALVRESELAHA